MNRPRNRWVRSLLVTSGIAVIAFAMLGIPAEAAAVQGTVRAGRTGLSVRSAATTVSARSGTVRTGTKVVIQCQVVGQRVRGRVRTTDRWDVLPDGRYVSDAFVQRSRMVPLCPAVVPVAARPVSPPMIGGTAVGRWVRPVPFTVVQGFRTISRPTHDGEDFMAPRWTPIHAPATGTVVTVTCNVSTGNCDVDGNAATPGCGWYAEIRHATDVVTRLCHMIRRPEVQVGQRVQAGQIIGYVGSSGRSSGPHLHFEVHSGYPATSVNAVDPMEFMQRAGASIG